MPLYEFRCGRCGARFERLVAVGTGRCECPECMGDARKVFSMFASSRDGKVTTGGSCESCTATSCEGCSG